jgi:hypothetical protein
VAVAPRRRDDGEGELGRHGQTRTADLLRVKQAL